MSAFDKHKTRQSFDRAAHRYDQSAGLQQQVAETLTDRQLGSSLQPSAILDLGCGTGQVAHTLCKAYPAAAMTALDFSPKMLDQTAKRLMQSDYHAELVCADAEHLPFSAASFDLIASSLMLQWSNDLQATLSACRDCLKEGGEMAFSTFLTGTLLEVRSSWETVDQEPHTSDFIELEALHQTLEAAGFSQIEIITETIVMPYPSVREMIMDIKRIGASNARVERERGLTGKARFAAFERAFDTFRRVDGIYPCTWQLAYVYVKK